MFGSCPREKKWPRWTTARGLPRSAGLRRPAADFVLLRRVRSLLAARLGQGTPVRPHTHGQPRYSLPRWKGAGQRGTAVPTFTSTILRAAPKGPCRASISRVVWPGPPGTAPGFDARPRCNHDLGRRERPTSWPPGRRRAEQFGRRLVAHERGPGSCRRSEGAALEPRHQRKTGDPGGPYRGGQRHRLVGANGRFAGHGRLRQTVRTWEAETGKLLHIFTGHTGPVHAVGWSANGQTLASATPDQTVRLWDPATGKPRHALRDHKAAVTSLAGRRTGTYSSHLA